jgi:hypothetical protein
MFSGTRATRVTSYPCASPPDWPHCPGRSAPSAAGLGQSTPGPRYCGRKELPGANSPPHWVSLWPVSRIQVDGFGMPASHSSRMLVSCRKTTQLKRGSNSSVAAASADCSQAHIPDETWPYGLFCNRLSPGHHDLDLVMQTRRIIAKTTIPLSCVYTSRLHFALSP